MMEKAQELLDSLPDEWKAKIESMPERHKPLSDEMARKIDALIISYYPARSMRQLAQVAGVKEHEIRKRVLQLQAEGRL